MADIQSSNKYYVRRFIKIIEKLTEYKVQGISALEIMTLPIGLEEQIFENFAKKRKAENEMAKSFKDDLNL